MNYQKQYEQWLNCENLDVKLKAELQAMSQQDIQEAFSKPLVFGTAGIRGIMGAGSSRMNIYTIRKASMAFIQYLQNHYSKDELNQGIIIAHDNRHFSKEFSQETANIFISYDIPVYLFNNNDLRPTPLLSYSIRKLNALGGVVITASHNPSNYNGFKIYDQDGCQFLPTATDEIGENMAKISDVVVFNLQDEVKSNLINFVNSEIEMSYLADIKAMQFYPENKNRQIKIVFSNQHGTSRDWVMQLLTSTNYEVIPVKEQYEFDPDFSNTPSPNPEDSRAFELAIETAKRVEADLIIVNDPDSDRIGIGVYHQGEYVLLNGNETAPIMLEYLLSHYQKREMMPVNPVMYNTFVTGHLSDLVAEGYGCQVIKTLTGFKWIGAEMKKEAERNLNFVFGFEEAYGYVVKDITRDKDGIAAALVLAEACSYYKQKNQSLVDVLEQLYKKYGYFYCHTVNVVLEGLEGQEKINLLLKLLRHQTIESLNNINLVKKEDYLQGLYNMPAQDLLKFYFADGSWFAVRASGTEPKIKFYFVCVDQSLEGAKMKMQTMFQELNTNYLKLEVKGI